ncbi:putative sensor-like histidine kinase [compost metagenome]
MKLEELPVPSMIIQPLVENAIIHGLDNLAEGGVIVVEVKEIRGGVQIKVCDNGAGFSADRLALVRRELVSHVREDDGKSIGLRNVNDRLVLLYGESSALVIASEPGSGACITFVIPGGELHCLK